MSSKLLYGGLATIVVGFLVAAIVFKAPAALLPGTARVDHGGGHGTSQKYGGDEPPTSGEHGNTIAWGIHTTPIADINVLHNLEHGGIYVSYRPDISKDDIAKIEKLFSVPSSKKEFNPAKAVVAPRAQNKANIILSSWSRSEAFTSFNESAMYDYYVKNFNHSPEPFAK